MSPREAVGMAMRELPARWRRLGIALMIGLALLPFAARVWAGVVRIVDTPAALEQLAERVESLETQTRLVNMRMERDSARSWRILCISEVQAKLRPQLDLQTRCAQ